MLIPDPSGRLNKYKASAYIVLYNMVTLVDTVGLLLLLGWDFWYKDSALDRAIEISTFLFS